MKLPRIYRVEIQSDVLVLAHSAQAAEEYVKGDYDVQSEIMDGADCIAVIAKRSTFSSAELNSLPYLSDDVDDPEHRRERLCKAWLSDIEDEEKKMAYEAEMAKRQLKIPGME